VYVWHLVGSTRVSAVYCVLAGLVERCRRGYASRCETWPTTQAHVYLSHTHTPHTHALYAGLELRSLPEVVARGIVSSTRRSSAVSLCSTKALHCACSSVTYWGHERSPRLLLPTYSRIPVHCSLQTTASLSSLCYRARVWWAA